MEQFSNKIGSIKHSAVNVLLYWNFKNKIDIILCMWVCLPALISLVECVEWENGVRAPGTGATDGCGYSVDAGSSGRTLSAPNC